MITLETDLIPDKSNNYKITGPLQDEDLAYSIPEAILQTPLVPLQASFHVLHLQQLPSNKKVEK